MHPANRIMIMLTVAALLLLVSACGDDDDTNGATRTPQVLLQLTETDEAAPLNTAVGALQERGFDAVVLVDGDFTEAHCERLIDLEAQRFEVMQFIRPEDEDGESTVMSALSREAQRAALAEGKDAIEACLGHPVEGVRMTRFDQNEDTYELVDELGYVYNLGFVARSSSSLPGHRDDLLPYRSPDYDFWAVPMHSVDLEGDVKAFCDKPMASLAADEWERLMIDELEATTAAGRPLLIEIHPSFLVPDTDRFDAFTSFLDHAAQQGADSVTVAEYVDWASSAR